MKKSTNVISLKRWRFNKKYGKKIEISKKYLPIIMIPIILAVLFMVDKVIMKFLLAR